MLSPAPCDQRWLWGCFNSPGSRGVLPPRRRAPQGMFKDPGRRTSQDSVVTVRGECVGRPEAGAVIPCYKEPECSMPHSVSYLQGVLHVVYSHFREGRQATRSGTSGIR